MLLDDVDDLATAGLLDGRRWLDFVDGLQRVLLIELKGLDSFELGLAVSKYFFDLRHGLIGEGTRETHDSLCLCKLGGDVQECLLAGFFVHLD